MMRRSGVADEDVQGNDRDVSASRPTDTVAVVPGGATGAAAVGAHARPIRWRRVAGQAAALWLATRAALLLFTCFAVAFHLGPHAPAAALTPRGLALHWQRWDALWYLAIAQHGYTSTQATAFFPLYPLLIHAATLLLGPHWLAAGLIVANLGTLAGFTGLALLAANEAGAEAPAWGAIRVLAAYPLAFFLAAPYSDGLFFAFVALGLLAARRRRWGWATACACLATLDRPTGVLLVAAVLCEYASAHGFWQWRRWRGHWREWRLRGLSRSLAGAALIAALAALAVGLYMAFLWHRFGDPLLFLHAEHQFWHHQSILPVHAPAPATHAAAPTPPAAWSFELARSLVDLAPVALFTLLVLAGVKRLPASFTLYMVCLLLLIVSSPRPDRLGFFVSAGRYFTAAVPAFLLLGRWVVRRPWLDLLLVSGGFLLQAVFAAYFLAGGWMV